MLAGKCYWANVEGRQTGVCLDRPLYDGWLGKDMTTGRMVWLGNEELETEVENDRLGIA